jgi:long-chain fatty acid transport protein
MNTNIEDSVGRHIRTIGLSVRGRVGVIALMVACVPSTSYAQASLQVPLEFDFLNPGARSLSLGSAFVALADDATAAFTNPAGLTSLSRIELTIEGRGRRTQSRFLDRGRLSGPLTNLGIDTIAGPSYGASIDASFAPTFVSLVFPHRNKLAIAVYRHELTASANTFRTQGVFQFEPAISSDVRETPLDASRELTITNYGGAFAYRPNPTITIGGGFSSFRMSLDSTFTRFVPVPFATAATYDPSLRLLQTSQSSSDNGFGGSVGFLWKPHRQFQVGGVVRRGPTFQFDQAVHEMAGGETHVTSGAFRVPTVVAAGFAYRPSDSVTLTFENTFVGYHSLIDDYINLQAAPSGRQARFTIDNNNQIHAGLEYALVRLPKTPALRVGYWFDPAHSIVYQPPAAADATDARFAAYLPPETALHHFTFGGGVPISEKLELNVAADLSARRKFYSGLAVVRF